MIPRIQLRALGALLLLAMPAAAAESVRVLVSIASDAGDPEDARLQFARADAERVRSLFVDIGGVSPDRAYLVLDQPAQAVRETLAEVSGRIAELAASGKEVLLIVYVSAHARAGVLHLAGTHLALAELRDYAQRSRASLRLLIVDACDSGAIARAKGGVPGSEYRVALQQLPLAGQVMISSSGPAEVSQEFDTLGGSLFTHHLLTGLRGDADADGNGQVTLGEAYTYAYHHTVAQAQGSTQHPTFDLDIRGAGELVLSQPVASRSALIFPAPLSGQYLVASQPRPDVLAEVYKQEGKPLTLAVQTGRYLLSKRVGRRVGLLTVDLTLGGRQVIDEREMVWRDYLEVSVKGGVFDPHPSSLFAVGSLGSAPLSGTGARWRAGVAYRRTSGELWALATLSGGLTSYRGVGLTTSELSGSTGLAAGMRWLAFSLVPFAGASVELTGLRQSYRRDDEAAVQRVFGQRMPGNAVLGVSIGPVAGVELPLPKGVQGLIYLQVPLRYLPADGEPTLTFGLQALLAIGWRP